VMSGRGFGLRLAVAGQSMLAVAVVGPAAMQRPDQPRPDRIWVHRDFGSCQLRDPHRPFRLDGHHRSWYNSRYCKEFGREYFR
jgi:hypothetical protein